MWPFRKKKAPEPERNDRQISEDLLLAFRKPGQTFMWAGVEMTVGCMRRHYLGCGIFQPNLQCWYADKSGKLDCLYFDIGDLASLWEQNPTSPTPQLDEGEKAK